MALSLTLVRHASTALSDERRYVGHLDPDLGADGEAEARALGRRLAPFVGPEEARSGSPSQLWSSDLRRARRTAELAFPERRIRTDPRLRELDFGAFDGATYDENLRRHGWRFRKWVEDPDGHPPPGGETLSSLVERVLDWLHDLEPDADVIAVAHGGPLRVLAARALARPPAEALRWSVPTAAILRTARPGRPS